MEEADGTLVPGFLYIYMEAKMNTRTRQMVWGGLALTLASVTCGTGCGNGFAVSNDPVEEQDVVQTADGSYTPADAGSLGNPDAVQTADGSYMPVDTVGSDADNPTQVHGWGVYCERKQTPGSTHLGVLVDMHVSDSDGINEMGLLGRGNHRVRFLQVYPASTEAAYAQAKRNYGLAGDVDLLSLYIVDDEGNEIEVPFKRISCEALDKLL